MQTTEPDVFLIARPSLDWREMGRYLDLVDGIEWLDRVLTDRMDRDAENLIEFAGRLCYRSWKPGLNANVTRVREDSSAYLQNMLKQLHGSVTEHANFTFVFHNVSRVFTHELVRHRAGVAISQESLRYVRLDALKVWLPEALETPPPGMVASDHAEFMAGVVQLVESLEDWQRQAAEHFGLDDDGVPFSYKKAVTSAMRRLAPIGLATTIVWTANVRTLRHVIEMRTAGGAEEEIRLVFNQVGEIMVAECPDLFADYSVVDGEWKPDWRKV